MDLALSYGFLVSLGTLVALRNRCSNTASCWLWWDGLLLGGEICECMCMLGMVEGICVYKAMVVQYTVYYTSCMQQTWMTTV